MMWVIFENFNTTRKLKSAHTVNQYKKTVSNFCQTYFEYSKCFEDFPEMAALC